MVDGGVIGTGPCTHVPVCVCVDHTCVKMVEVHDDDVKGNKEPQKPLHLQIISFVWSYFSHCPPPPTTTYRYDNRATPLSLRYICLSSI